MQFYAATSTKEDINDAISEIYDNVVNLIDGNKVNLAFVFSSPHYQENYESLLNKFQKDFTPDVLLGCMGESIIGNKDEIEKKHALTLWMASLPDVTITPFNLQNGRSKQGEILAKNFENLPSSENNPVFIVLAEPFSTDAKALLSYLNKEYPKAPVIGGMASGAFTQGGNTLFYNKDIINEGVVGIALTGAINVQTVVSQGCRPIGESFFITKAEQNVIQALGGKTALQCYQEIYKNLNHEDKLLAQMGVHIGLVVNEYKEKFERGDFLIRNLVGVDESSGAVAITDFVRVGQTAQFMIRDAKSAHEDLEQLLTNKRVHTKQNDAQGALIFSCNGRGLNLFPEPSHDVNCVKKIMGDIPTSGFFAQGEIGPIGGVNFLHGFTASIALFCKPEWSR